MSKKAVVIISGGMDSTTLLYEIKDKYDKVYGLSFNYKQRHMKELECAMRTCACLGVEHKIMDLSVLNELAPSSLTRDDWDVPEGHYADENMKETVVPNRNMVMLSLATSFAISKKAHSLYYGAHSGDHDIYPDCRLEFVLSIQRSVELCDWHQLRLKAPYLKMDKGDIVIKGKRLNVDYSLTWTCYKGLDVSCGKCGSCTERLEAFEKANLKDPLEYDKNIVSA